MIFVLPAHNLQQNLFSPSNNSADHFQKEDISIQTRNIETGSNTKIFPKT